MKFLELKNLYKYYSIKDLPLYALNNVSFNVEKGQFVSLIGDSGAGKSTLLNMVGCLDRPDKGGIYYNGTDIFKLSPQKIALYRNKTIGFVFQSFNLSGIMTALENVELPLIYAGKQKKQRRDMALRALALVGMSDRAYHLPSQLSGGQKQRVAIARAIVNEPDILLADEPTGNLDTKSGSSIMELLKKINESGTTLITVTHNLSHTNYGNRIIELKNGQIVTDKIII